MGRNGISPEDAKEAVLRKPSLIGTLLLRMGECDALDLRHGRQVPRASSPRRRTSSAREPDAPVFAAMNGLLLPNRTLFVCDTYVNRDPSAEQLAEITRLAADVRAPVRPRAQGGAAVALQFRQRRFATPRARCARYAGCVAERVSGLEVDGEMHGDAALSEAIRSRVHPDSTLKGEANLLVMPNLDAANISFNLLKITGGDGVTIGPILLGARKAVLIATPSATVRRLVNLDGAGRGRRGGGRRLIAATATPAAWSLRFGGALVMTIRPVVPKGDALRHAVAWLAEQDQWTPELVHEACLRFDVSPADEEFLLAECRRLRAQRPRRD